MASKQEVTSKQRETENVIKNGENRKMEILKKEAQRREKENKEEIKICKQNKIIFDPLEYVKSYLVLNL